LKDETLKAYGLKTTAPRSKILQLLRCSENRHMSAEDVFNILRTQSDDVALATVYRVLNQFEDAGLVIRHNFDSGLSVYELDSGEHHDHLVCVKCAKVIEFVDQKIERQQALVAKQNHFKIQHHSLIIYGLCPGCQ
jgi:Fur family transcriptional regulator, ferric uptake regulator